MSLTHVTQSGCHPQVKLEESNPLRITPSVAFLDGPVPPDSSRQNHSRNETLTFILIHRYLTQVAHSVSIGNPSRIHVMHMFVLMDESAHKSNLEPLLVDCRQYRLTAVQLPQTIPLVPGTSLTGVVDIVALLPFEYMSQYCCPDHTILS